MSKSIEELQSEKELLQDTLLAHIQAFRKANPNVGFEIEFVQGTDAAGTNERASAVKITLWI